MKADMDRYPRILSSEDWDGAQTVSPDHVPNVFRIDEVTIAKTGLDEARAKSEVAAMELARSRTSIPIPNVYNCYFVEATEQWCILMEYIQGEVLQEAWDEASGEWKASIIQQLKTFMAELRSIKGNLIGTVDGQSCRDQFFEDQSETYGPFATEKDFHNALIDVMRATQQNAWVEIVAGFVQSLPAHEIVLTHSDLAPRNIIVRDGKVVAILDWELAGYYPEYWEYVKAYYLPSWDSGWIKERPLDEILQSFPVEHAVLIHANGIVW